MIVENKISSRTAKTFIEIVEEDFDPENYAKEHGLIQEFDEGKLKTIAESIVLRTNCCHEYKAGKEKSIQFLVGQFMKESKGSANPTISFRNIKRTIEIVDV